MQQNLPKLPISREVRRGRLVQKEGIKVLGKWILTLEQWQCNSIGHIDG
jgi:hypothetical protein